jgi:heavy metal sensor kinase
VQSAVSLDQLEATIGKLQRWLWLLVPTTLAFTSLAGWLLASLAMRPLARMVANIQGIGARNLHERVYVPATGDEIERLGVRFNDMLERLERTFQRMRQFSAAASHELRTPLTVMKGELEVALRKTRTPQEYKQVLRTHLETIDEMAAMVQELLALARDETAEGEIEWRPVDLCALVDGMSRAWSPLAQSKRMGLEVSVDGPAWVFGERRLLERLISNLIDNAIRHTHEGGKVVVEVTREGKDAQICIRDTGEGIPQEELPNIFDRFFRVKTENSVARPSGLGLGFCRWVAEAHNGGVEVASPHAKGVIATVRLPLIGSML